MQMSRLSVLFWLGLDWFHLRGASDLGMISRGQWRLGRLGLVPEMFYSTRATLLCARMVGVIDLKATDDGMLSRYGRKGDC